MGGIIINRVSLVKSSMVVILVMLVGLMSVPVAGEEGNVEGDREVEVLSLNKVVEITLENHSQLKIAEYNLNNARLELKKLELMGPEKVSAREIKEKEEALEKAEENMDKTRMELAFKAEDSYYQLLRSMQSLESKKRNLEWVDQELKIAEVKYNNGLISKNSLDLLQREKELADEELAEADFNLKTAKMKLNQSMGRELKQLFKPADEVVPYRPVEVDLAESVKYALEHRMEMEEARLNVEEGQKDLELKKEINAAPVEITRAEQTYDQACLELKTVEKEIIINVRDRYINLISSRNRVNNSNWDYETAKKDLEILKIKYEEGLIPLMDMVDGYNKLAAAEITWIQSVYDYNIARAIFNRETGKSYGLQIEKADRSVENRTDEDVTEENVTEENRTDEDVIEENVTEENRTEEDRTDEDGSVSDG